MSVNEWGPLEWLLLALSTVVAVALPPAMRLKLATPTLLRERVLYSRPRAVVVQTVMLRFGACAVGIPLGLGVERFPILWGTVLLAVAALFSSLWYAYLYRRTLRQMEDEVAAQFTHERPAPPQT